MAKLMQTLRKFFSPPRALPPGSHAFQSSPDADHPYRLHLRIEADGSGLFIINAATVLHLNQSATEYAYHYIKQSPREQIGRLISKRYKVNAVQAQQDYDNFLERLETFIHTPDLDPEMYLEFNRLSPYSKVLSAPYRLDCALTYRLPEGVDTQSALQKRAERELTTDQWKAVFDIAWKIGIPHLIFTGGEPTLRADLVELIRHAEANGQVTGLLTDGLRLVDREYFQSLANAGLDHIMMVLNPDLDQSWQALEVILPDDMFTAVHLTITPENKNRLADVIQRLAKMGVNGISLSASDPSLSQTIQRLRDMVHNLHLNLIWDLPVPYSKMSPVHLELDQEGEKYGAGYAWLYVEPDGDVLPAQGINQVAGNILRDPWEIIWQNVNPS
jgi:hypothetical protein